MRPFTISHLCVKAEVTLKFLRSKKSPESPKTTSRKIRATESHLHALSAAQVFAGEVQ